MQTEDLRFTPSLLRRPIPHGLAVETTLHHMVSVTYAVDPEKLRRHLHRRFEPDCISLDGRGPTALVSVVTFLDRDFRFVACPWPTSTFGQTNYRAYVTDSETGEHVAWFFGTCLDSISVAIPRHLWQLPWHRARLDFKCPYDEGTACYTSFAVATRSAWAPADLVVADSGQSPRRLEGFTNLESGLVVLTHPLRGYFFRRDGALGTYNVWHDRLETTEGSILKARYPLLQRLGLVQEDTTHCVHSVLLQRSVDFTIYLPPIKLRG
jgi:uncharacterized protein YqjF (DUF2071 family)